MIGTQDLPQDASGYYFYLLQYADDSSWKFGVTAYPRRRFQDLRRCFGRCEVKGNQREVVRMICVRLENRRVGERLEDALREMLRPPLKRRNGDRREFFPEMPESILQWISDEKRLTSDDAFRFALAIPQQGD